MARAYVNVQRNRDNTITVKIGHSIEHFSLDKSKDEVFECVKWSIISKGVNMDDTTLIELLHEAGVK